MKIAAGNELNHRKPTHAPTRQAQMSARSCWFVESVMAVKASRTIAEQPAARAARASGGVTPLVAPAGTRKISSGEEGARERGASQNREVSAWRRAHTP